MMYRTKRAALAARNLHGGWVIRFTDTRWWHDNDLDAAEDALLPNADEDRALAHEMLRDPWLSSDRAPVITFGVAARLRARARKRLGEA